MKWIYRIAVLLLMTETVFSQNEPYTGPSDPLVQQKLNEWQDCRFGMIVHWGLYSVPGIVESWSLCSEDAAWIPRDSTMGYEKYKEYYWGLIRQFNPIRFDPDQWADAAERAGMKYVVFTTKHHDGFCLFDTRQTEFKVTGSDCPFKSRPRADVLKYVFEAFRKKGFMTGAYFSKPDWHSEYYWWPRYATPDRNNNYDTRLHPYRWEKFKDYTYAQLQEILSNYGKVDILWLDGGWVRPDSTINAEVRSWGQRIPPWEQDIDMPRIAAMARMQQPGILIVDRSVHGPFEDYRTPEQQVPGKLLPYPWETCMTLGNAWGYVADDQFKSSRRLIHTLCDVAAKGGNLLLGVGPQPDGLIAGAAVKTLDSIGSWLKINGEAIYATRPLPPYRDDNLCFTQKEGGERFIIMLCDEMGNMPLKIRLKDFRLQKHEKLSLLGMGKARLKLKQSKEGTEISIPGNVRNHPPCGSAWVIKVKAG